MRPSKAILLPLILICLLRIEPAHAQRQVTPLQPGATIEREIGRGMIHRFNLSLEKDQYVQLVVDQHGIDLVIRVYSQDGKSFGEFDTPNGDQGLENVSWIAISAGVYLVDVAPLGQIDDVSPGHYEIKIVEVRHATEQELLAGRNEDVLRARGIKLLTEISDTLQQIHLPQTRVRAQLKAAQLLWASDEKLARQLVTDGIAGVKEYMASVDNDEQNYYQSYSLAMQLRQEVVQVLGPHDPELALEFLRSTRTLSSPETGPNNNQLSQELASELNLASLISAKDPKRAFQIAEDALKSGYSSSLTDTVNHLRDTDQELAARLAKEIAAKLQGEKLLNNQEAANLAVNLLRLAHSQPGGNRTSSGTAAAATMDLLSEQEYRDLFAKTLKDGLSYSPPAANIYTPERNAAQNILNSLRSMTAEMQGYAPGSVTAVETKTNELNNPQDPRSRLWNKYGEAINNGTLDSALEAISQAPQEMRDQLYQQIAGKASAAGDFARARQILQERISNPIQRRQALANLDQQAIYFAINHGKIDEALRSLSQLRTSKERANILGEIANQIGPGQKRATALNLLEQARSLLGASVQAEDQEQMNALLQIAQAFSRYDSKRPFEVVEPLLDQFNEMSAAAVALNGFGQQYYQDGELAMQGGNGLANAANQLIVVLGSLAETNFERARADAERVQRPEVRIGALLAIAQQAINPQGAAAGNVTRRVSFHRY